MLKKIKKTVKGARGSQEGQFFMGRRRQPNPTKKKTNKKRISEEEEGEK